MHYDGEGGAAEALRSGDDFDAEQDHGDVDVPIPGLSDADRAFIAVEFDRLVQSLGFLHAAVLATIDGFAIKAYCPHPSFNARHLAAMASSLTALSTAALREVSFDGLDRLLIESAGGRIIFQPFRSVIPCTVCVAVPARELLGRTLWSLDAFVKALAR